MSSHSIGGDYLRTWLKAAQNASFGEECDGLIGGGEARGE